MDLLLSTASFLASVKITRGRIEEAIEALEIPKYKNMEFINRRAIRVTAVQYAFRRCRTLEEYLKDINRYLEQAVKTSAHLVIFPELMGLCSLPTVPLFEKIEERFKAYSDPWIYLESILKYFSDCMLEIFQVSFSSFAKRYGVCIMAGSTYVFQDDKLFNRGFFFDPEGEIVAVQDKLFPSARELKMGVCPGEDIEIMTTPMGKMAMFLGDDDFYYEPFKIAALSGVNLAAISSAQQGEYNNYRDLGAAAARAAENGLFCAKSVLVGTLWTREKYSGSAGIYSPYTASKKPHGVLAQAQTSDQEELISSRLDMQRLEESRDRYNSFYNDQVSVKYADCMQQLFRSET